MAQNPTAPVSLLETAADADLALVLIGRFFAGQVGDGELRRDDMAAFIRECANAVADRRPTVSHHVTERAMTMANALPE